MIENETKTINVVLTPREIDIINSHVEETGLGGKGFSAALRQIIREWAEIKAETKQPAQAETH